MNRKTNRVMNIGFLALLVLLFIGVASDGLAQEVRPLQELTLEELLATKIEISSSKAQVIFTTPSTVSVIDQAMIQQYRIGSVAEALNLIPGMDVMRTYLKRDVPTARGILQDHYANKVLVLLNGIPSWNAVTGEASIAHVSINDVERIEVLKGPASVLYGTNAYAGAINIVLKSSRSEVAEPHVRFGSQGVFGAGGSYSFSSNDVTFFVSGNSSDERGEDYYFIDEKGVGGHVQEYIKGSNATLNVSFGSHSLFLNAYTAHESYLGVDPAFASGAGNDHVSDGYLAQYRFSKKLWDLIGFKYGAVYDWNQRNLSRSLDDNTRANLKGYRVTNTLGFDYAFTNEFSAEVAIDYDFRKGQEYKNYNVSRDSVLAVNDMQDRSVKEYAVAAQLSYTGDPISLLVGTRFTRNDLFGNNISSRATAVYSLNERNSLKLIWGQSYRAPALFELYFRTPTNTVFGNSNLKPETSTSIELAYLTSFGDVFVQALAYHSTYGNKIFRVRRVPASATDKSTIYTNGSAFSANGIEIDAKYQNPKFVNAFVNYNYIKGDEGDNVDGHFNFKYVPCHTFSGGIAKTVENFTFSGLVNFQSETKGPLSGVSSYYTLDLSVGYEQALLSRSFRHSISAKNVFDKQVSFPEYVRRTLNQVPSGYGRRVAYEVQIIL